MTRLLLDTTFLIDVERGDGDLDALVHDDDDVAIAAITATEMRVGAELAHGERRAGRRAFVEAILDTIPTLPYDDGSRSIMPSCSWPPGDPEPRWVPTI